MSRAATQTEQTSRMEIVWRDPADLRLHPAAEMLPKPDPENPRFAALCDDVIERGLVEPLVIDEHNRVLIDQDRWRAAKAAQLAEVPCVVKPHAEAWEIVFLSVALRRHLTPGQRAYILAGHIRPAFEAAFQRRLQNLRKRPMFLETRNPRFDEETPAQWAKKAGIRERLLQMANEILGYWKEYPEPMLIGGRQCTLEAHFEPLILPPAEATKPVPLDRILAGIKSRLGFAGPDHGGGRPEDAERRRDLFEEGFEVLEKRLCYWQGMNEEDRRQALGTIESFYRKMPKDLLTENLRLTKEALKKCREN